MTRAAQVVKGLLALVLLVALVAAVPWALWHYIGWPLPHALPSVSQVTTALGRQGIANTTLLKALACVVWVAWAILVVSVAVELDAAVRGRGARRLRIARPLQPMVGQLLAAIVVAALALAPRPGAEPRPLSATVGTGRPTPPVAAMALAGDRAPGPVPATSPTRAVAGAGRFATYVVKRNDTLWAIAERELGDPLRWSEIYALNEGRPEPGGAVLDDPNWIYPGWTLLLPAPAAPAPTSPPSPPRVQSPTPPSPGAPPTSGAPGAPPTSAPPPPTARTGNPVAGHQPAAAGADHGRPMSEPARPPLGLPTGSVVAGSFAAGVLSAMAAGRLRRRHAYRYRPPRPGRDLSPAPLRPTLTHLVHAAGERRGAAGDEPAAAESPEPAASRPARALDVVEIARRGEEAIAVALGDLSGLAICDPAADDIARALLAGLVVGAGPGAAEVVLAGEAASRLLAGAAASAALRAATSADAAARILEAECIARTRRLGAAGTADAEQFRRDNPENPLPVLLALCDPPSATSAGRWAALAAGGPRLGIAVVYPGDTPAAVARLATDEARRVVVASPEPLARRLSDAELFGLSAAEAAELLDAVTESLTDEPERADEAASELDGHAGSTALDGRPGPAAAGDGAGEPWPEPAGADAPGDRPIRVQLFGHLAVEVCGAPVADGLRSRAKMLLAWYLLRPEGATSEQAVDTLWPDTAPDQVGRQFWRAFGDLRTRLRDAGGEGLDVLVKAGDHYQPAATEIACDLWELQAALRDAARAEDDDSARAALRRGVEAYRGELLDGCDWLWVEPVRADLHRRALDAHLRLAELEVAAGHPDAAAGVLERAVDLDRYAEEPYRRLMTIQGAAGRTDAVRATWRLLQRRLAELDLEVEPQTARLYRDLTDQPAARLQRTGVSS